MAIAGIAAVPFSLGRYLTLIVASVAAGVSSGVAGVRHGIVKVKIFIKKTSLLIPKKLCKSNNKTRYDLNILTMILK